MGYHLAVVQIEKNGCAFSGQSQTLFENESSQRVIIPLGSEKCAIALALM